MGGCCCRGLGSALGSTKEPTTCFVPSKDRGCTDILFLLLYILSWGGMLAAILASTARGGTPYRIFHGVDVSGNVCGGSGASGKDYNSWVYFPTTIAEYSTFNSQDCQDCFYIRTCLRSCNDTFASYPPPTDSTMGGQQLTKFTTNKFLSFCIPDADVLNSNGVSFAFNDEFQSASELASRAISDLYTAWPIILISAAIALILSYVYTFLAERWAGVLVFFALVVIVAGGFLGAYTLIKSGKEARDDNLNQTNRGKAMYGIGIVLGVVTAIFLLIVIALRERIYIAIEVVKEACRAIDDMPLLTFFPIIPMFAGLGYFVFWIVVSLYIFSVWNTKLEKLPIAIQSHPNFDSTQWPTSNFTNTDGSWAIKPAYFKYEWDQNLKNTFAFVFFHLLWTVQFFVYFCYMVIAGAIANWYFTPRDANDKKIRGSEPNQLSSTPITDSCCRTFRFHMGTIALGALIIAVVQFIRAVVMYIEKQTSGPNPNRLQKCIFCMIHCFLACLECCLDKINKNAFVWTAVWGDSFGTAACSSFKLVWGNLARTGAMSIVSHFLMFLGKLLVAIATTGICGIIIKSVYPNLNSPVLPMIIIFVLSYMIAALFMAVFETTIDTVFLCFLIDEKVNRASGTMLASPGLRSIVEKNKDRCEAHAKQQHDLSVKRASALGTAQEANPGANQTQMTIHPNPPQK